MIRVLFISLLVFSSSISLVFSQNSAHSNSQVHRVVVKDILQTTSYTYLKVVESNSIIWMAVPKMDAIIDHSYYYSGGMEMRDFRSKELDTTFHSIIFLNGVFDEKTIQPESGKEGNAPTVEADVLIAPAEGGITTKELFLNRKKYAGKSVLLKGRVTKFSASIMGRNWIHLDDGSNPAAESDVTITSDEHTKVGEVIVIQGTVVLNKDFGSGYFYEIIVEKGKILHL